MDGSVAGGSGEWTCSGVALGDERARVEAAMASRGDPWTVGEEDRFEDPSGGSHTRRTLRAEGVETSFGGRGPVRILFVDGRVVSVAVGVPERPQDHALSARFGSPRLATSEGAVWYDDAVRRGAELRREEGLWVVEIVDYGRLVETGLMSEEALRSNLRRLPASR